MHVSRPLGPVSLAPSLRHRHGALPSLPGGTGLAQNILNHHVKATASHLKLLLGELC